MLLVCPNPTPDLTREPYQSVVIPFTFGTVAEDKKICRIFSRPQHMGVGQVSAHLFAGEGCIYMNSPNVQYLIRVLSNVPRRDASVSNGFCR